MRGARTYLLALALAAALPAAAQAGPVTNTNPSGPGSLRDAIATAAPGDTINVPASPNHYAINPGGEIAFAKALTIAGAGAGQTIIDAGGLSRIFNVTSGPFTLSGVTLTGGNSSSSGAGGGGGALRYVAGAALTLRDCAFTASTTTVSSAASTSGGGGVHITSTQPTTITNCTFSGNTASTTGGSAQNGGGALLISSGSTTDITGSTFTGNTATVGANANANGGGGLMYAGAGLTLTGTTFSGNTFTVTSGASMSSSGGGGLVSNTGSPITITNSAIRDNTANLPGATGIRNGGGGYHLEGSALTLSGSDISGNHFTITSAGANAGGGGLYINTGSAASITSSTVSGNVADITPTGGFNGGGGVHDEGAPLAITGSAIDGNTSTVRAGGASENGGGGLYTNTGSPVSLTDSSVSQNTTTVASGTTNGGGAINANGHGPALTNVTLANNTASPTSGAVHGGGAVLTNFGAPAVTFLNTTIAGNATDGTGGVFLIGGGITLRNSILSANGAANCATAGGGAFTSGGNNVESLDTCSLGAPPDRKSTDPLLGPLGLHSGPTQTMMLFAGSPALDNGATCPAADQRGVARPVGAACDSGAVEDQLPTATTGAATILSSTSVRLDGQANPLFTPGTAHFDFGTAVPYSSQTPAQSAGEGGTPFGVAATLTGLKPHTAYHYRLSASNALAGVGGADASFTTPFSNPVVTRFRVTPSKFRVAPGRTAVTARRRAVPRGTRLKFSLNESARVRIRIYQSLAGRRSGKRCVKPTKRLRRARRCTRLVLKGTLTRRTARQGANSIRFTGRIGRRKLASGSYRAIITATKTGALRGSAAKTARFKIVR